MKWRFVILLMKLKNTLLVRKPSQDRQNFGSDSVLPANNM